MDLKVGEVVAVHSIEEPFFLAKLINIYNKYKIKVKWFDKLQATKQGTTFLLSYEDTIEENNVICQVKLVKQSRFSFLLTNEQEDNILSLLHNEKINEDISEDDLVLLKIDKRKERNQIDAVDKVKEFLSSSGTGTEESNCITNFEDIYNSEEFNEISSPIDTINVVRKIHFNETASISNKSPPNINEDQKKILFGECKSCLLVDNQSESLETNSTVVRENLVSNDIYPECQENPIEKECEIIQKNVTFDKNDPDLPDSTPSPPYVDSGSEYVPSSGSSDIEIPVIKNITFPSKIIANLPSVKCSEELDLSSASDDSERGIIVKCSKKTDTGRRIYDKKHICYFCYKPMSKMARHLAVVHSKEVEISRLLALPEKSFERKEGFLCILRAGNYFHNIEVLSTKIGELILSRRPPKYNNYTSRDYGPCPNCLGFFLTSNLWHHIKYNCPKNSSLNTSTQGKNVSRRDIRGESYALLGQSIGTSQEYQKHILASFKHDDVGEICRQDPIIIKFGSMLYEKYTSQQHEHIRQTMRQLGRLLLQTRKLDSGMDNLQEIMMPKNFDILISAVQQLCVSERDDTHSRVYGIPSLALKLGHSLRKCSLIVRGIALRKGDLDINRKMESFLDLMTLEWNTKISSAALRTLKEKQINATQLLPITSDIMKLNTFLDLTIKELVGDKNLMLSFNNWQKLAQATLCRIILFNKRRSGEAARMTLHQYAVRPNWSEQCTSELKKSLTPLENNLANKLIVVEVIGKSRKNFKVPILLTQEMKAAVDKLIETRDQVGIARNNVYVFARGSGSTSAIRGHDCLRKFVKDANLEQPSSLTSTKLRKYIATVVQVLDLKNKEYDWLARHLGHDIRIHRQFYRLHESAVELTKISRLLLTLDKGEITKFKGKSLDEINVAELPDIESEGDSEEENEDSDQEKKSDTMEDGASFSKKDEKSIDHEINVNIYKHRSSSPLIRRGSTKSRRIKKNIRCTDRDKQVLIDSTKRNENPKSARIQRPWSSEEREVLLKFFRIHLRKCIVPKKEEAVKCISENQTVLATRSWKDVKNWIYNKIKTLKGKK